jgi:hypothetical protein
MIGRKIGVLDYRSKFKLTGRHFIVAGLGGNPELEELALGLEHEGENPFWTCAEVVIFELLALGGARLQKVCGLLTVSLDVKK